MSADSHLASALGHDGARPPLTRPLLFPCPKTTNPALGRVCRVTVSRLLDLDRQAVVDLFVPDRWTCDMHRLALGVDRHGNRHILHVELVDRFHAQFGEGHHTRLLDRLGDQVGCTADGHQVHGLVVLDCFDGNRAALGFTDHAEQASAFEDLPGELVHPRGGGRAGWAYHFFAYRIDRADVIDKAAFEVHRQLFTLVEHVDHALVRGVAAGEHLAVEQDGFARLPALHVFRGQGVEIDAARARSGFPDDFRVGGQVWRFQLGRAGAVEHEVGVTGGGAVGDHAHRQAGGVGRVIHDLDVEHGGQAAQALGTDAQLVDLLEQFQAQFFDTV